MRHRHAVGGNVKLKLTNVEHLHSIDGKGLDRLEHILRGRTQRHENHSSRVPLGCRIGREFGEIRTRQAIVLLAKDHQDPADGVEIGAEINALGNDPIGLGVQSAASEHCA